MLDKADEKGKGSLRAHVVHLGGLVTSSRQWKAGSFFSPGHHKPEALQRSHLISRTVSTTVVMVMTSAMIMFG